MAKQDFCFTYYDGDAARDMAHMNRLERGCYTDLIISQRKFGRLTEGQIKKTLGNDFTECWPAIELVMLKDADEKYYIEWLENSIEKMKRQARKQSENGKRGGRPVKPDESEPKPNLKPNQSEKKPLGSGDGDGQELKEEGMGEENFLIPKMANEFKKLNPKYPIDKYVDFPALHEISVKIFKMDVLRGWMIDHHDEIMKRWGEIVIHIRADSHFSKYSISQINKHFQSVIQSLNANGNQNQQARKSNTHQPVITGRAESAGTL